MQISALLTSAGINIGICTLLLSLYSVLRKQPGNYNVYFRRWFSEELDRHPDSHIMEGFVPPSSWIVKAWQYTEDEILSVAGLDAVVFLRAIIFSIRIFSIAAVICIFGILPLNYFGRGMHRVDSELLDLFSIGNVMRRSRWLWVHCCALYVISLSACILLYSEYKKISNLRQFLVTRSPPNPSHFTVLVRGIPESTEELSDTIRNYFTKYHGPSYLSHQMVYRVGKIRKIMRHAKKVYRKFVHFSPTGFDQRCRPRFTRCGLCGGISNSFQLIHNNSDIYIKRDNYEHSFTEKKKECSAAFVFFKTRYAAVVASEVLQSSNPMLWVTDLAPEPNDVYWTSLWLPYRQVWLRRIATLLATVLFMILFSFPMAIVQGLSQLDELQERLTVLKDILEKPLMIEIVTGYLPSVFLMLFLYTVPPIMMLFSSVEGPISRSGRKRSTCTKVLYFTIWNVFFFNVFSGSIIDQIDAISRPSQIPVLLAKAVPTQATFFIPYVLTSGWASLSFEITQLFGVLWNFFRKYVFGVVEDEPATIPSFPYHTEIPRVVLFGLAGFTCSVLAPLVLPFLLVYFILGYVVYRNQLMNVYCARYETGGRMWPIVHNTTIFSLVMTQIIAAAVFGLKESPVVSSFMVPLMILTLLFNEYCRQRFQPLFKNFAAQDLIEMDNEDEQSGRMKHIHEQLLSAYCQFEPESHSSCMLDEEAEGSSVNDRRLIKRLQR